MSDYIPPNPDYPTGLIDQLKPLMTPKIIKEIALSDFGFVSRGYRAIFQEFIDQRRIPRPMRGDPREAFNITRWWSPEFHQEHEIRRLSLKEAHIARAFSCTCLLCTIDEEREEPEDIIPQLIESSYEINPQILQDAIELIQWAEAIKNPPSNAPDRIVHDYIVMTECAKLIVASMLNELEHEAFHNVQTILESGPRVVVGGTPNSFQYLKPTGNWIFAEVLKHCTARETWTALAHRWLLQPPKNWDAQNRDAVTEVAKLMLPK